MRLAKRVTVANADASDNDTKTFSSEEFRRIQRSFYFLGSVCLWRTLERTAAPEPLTCFHALGILRELAPRHCRIARDSPTRPSMPNASAIAASLRPAYARPALLHWRTNERP
jgi:hypothetical protein